MFAGHNEPLELVDHLSQQVEGLGVVFHVVCDHLCPCHHLVAKTVDVLTAVLDAAGHCLDSGPELIHAALFGELNRMLMLMEFWLALLILCPLWLVLVSFVTRSSLDHRAILELCLVFAMRSSLIPMLPARCGESVNPLLLSGAMNCRTRRCCMGSKRVHPSERRGSAWCRDVP